MSESSTTPSERPTMWTTRVRERAVNALPPEKLLPDRQPAYVSSWIYVFGVAAIAALIVIVASGMILGLKGPAWWHTSDVGKFFNSIHLWAVELFFFTMVVHLWGKFFMGAWRDGRGRTWVTGAITFLVAIGAAFTGYLSQQNFDSQWIASEGKDGLNSVGIGAFFNVADFGQMYTFHILLLRSRWWRWSPGTFCWCAGTGWFRPIRRGSLLPPRPAPPRAAARRERAEATPTAAEPGQWQGETVRYDLVKELVVALGVIGGLTVILAILFSSPDVTPVTIQSWAKADPA